MINSFSGKYRFLSNFYPCLGSSVEHHFQAQKTFDDEYKARIFSAKTANEAKSWGRKAPLKEYWELNKLNVMKMLVKIKFSIDPLKTLLLNTGNEKLVEGNAWGDCFWGVCKGVGENNLGKILMQVREDLREGNHDNSLFSR